MVTFKALSIAGLGVLGAGAISVGGYAAIASKGGNDQSTEENTRPTIAPAINKRLLESGYTFNPPQFTSYDKLIQGCQENLIKVKRSSSVEADEEGDEEGDEEDESFDLEKLYGCGVAKMDLWDSGDQFGSEKVHYLTFGSEIFLRKGNEGWRINTLIDNNNSNELVYRHLLSFLSHQSGESWKTMEAFLIEEKVKDENQQGLEQAEKKGIALTVGKEELNIKVPGIDGSWFKKDNFLIRGTVPPGSTLTKTNHETKEWSGIWVEDSSKPSQGMFQDIEVFIGNQEKEQVFCKERNKCRGGIGDNYKKDYRFEQNSIPNTWEAAYATLTNPNNSADYDNLRYKSGATGPILDFIKASKGKWSNSNEVCNAKNTEISSDELKKLKVFCSKTSH